VMDKAIDGARDLAWSGKICPFAKMAEMDPVIRGMDLRSVQRAAINSENRRGFGLDPW